MPELPEVETTRRGIAPALEGRRISALQVRERRLRWPVPAGLEQRLRGQRVLRVSRRAKYLLLETAAGTALMHLGMSGSLRIVMPAEPPETHDHFDICTDAGDIIRFNDPRRFGSLLWGGMTPLQHPLLAQLGPEPLGAGFNGAHLWELARHRKVAVKSFIMNSQVVAGVGNIYANEALFRAGIHPQRAAGRIALQRMERLAAEIRAVLAAAIQVGGTTLRDYRGGDGKPGYFRQRLQVYERGGEPCRACATPVRHIVQAQRSTYYCTHCQR
ncbi:MAG: bifunctional DNA-formamidopyrimidine glycosylase/DNA-(apurinic or apyrimidinic site) lyase [Gammaproteobacteria bacterium]|jgi:formamidopyrimidine-DNA glycosylase|nr:bifunctional DNA-formamidopyrimidine glycosylase/DNA-(apurinic or apyrimidinic site) lyase [Gammaproteobacteria bacterium]